MKDRLADIDFRSLETIPRGKIRAFAKGLNDFCLKIGAGVQLEETTKSIYEFLNRYHTVIGVNQILQDNISGKSDAILRNLNYLAEKGLIDDTALENTSKELGFKMPTTLRRDWSFHIMKAKPDMIQWFVKKFDIKTRAQYAKYLNNNYFLGLATPELMDFYERNGFWSKENIMQEKCGFTDEADSFIEQEEWYMGRTGSMPEYVHVPPQLFAWRCSEHLKEVGSQVQKLIDEGHIDTKRPWYEQLNQMMAYVITQTPQFKKLKQLQIVPDSIRERNAKEINNVQHKLLQDKLPTFAETEQPTIITALKEIKDSPKREVIQYVRYRASQTEGRIYERMDKFAAYEYQWILNWFVNSGYAKLFTASGVVPRAPDWVRTRYGFQGEQLQIDGAPPDDLDYLKNISQRVQLHKLKGDAFRALAIGNTLMIPTHSTANDQGLMESQGTMICLATAANSKKLPTNIDLTVMGLDHDLEDENRGIDGKTGDPIPGYKQEYAKLLAERGNAAGDIYAMANEMLRCLIISEEQQLHHAGITVAESAAVEREVRSPRHVTAVIENKKQKSDTAIKNMLAKLTARMKKK